MSHPAHPVTSSSRIETVRRDSSLIVLAEGELDPVMAPRLDEQLAPRASNASNSDRRRPQRRELHGFDWPFRADQARLLTRPAGQVRLTAGRPYVQRLFTITVSWITRLLAHDWRESASPASRRRQLSCAGASERLCARNVPPTSVGGWVALTVSGRCWEVARLGEPHART